MQSPFKGDMSPSAAIRILRYGLRRPVLPRWRGIHLLHFQSGHVAGDRALLRGSGRRVEHRRSVPRRPPLSPRAPPVRRVRRALSTLFVLFSASFSAFSAAPRQKTQLVWFRLRRVRELLLPGLELPAARQARRRLRDGLEAHQPYYVPIPFGVQRHVSLVENPDRKSTRLNSS